MEGAIIAAGFWIALAIYYGLCKVAESIEKVK